MGLAAPGSCPRPPFRGGVGLNQQRLRIRSPERSRNSSGESPARRVRSVHSHLEEQILASEGWECARCWTTAVDTAARGSSRECAETACGLRERRCGGASRAVPGGARPSAHRRYSGHAGYEYEFFYATASCIDENAIYLSRARVVSPTKIARGPAVAIKTAAIAG